jgi:hypothetical protein
MPVVLSVIVPGSGPQWLKPNSFARINLARLKPCPFPVIQTTLRNWVQSIGLALPSRDSPFDCAQGRRRRLSLRVSICFQAACFPDYLFQFWQVVMLLWRRERDRGVQACDADYGAIEVIEGFFVDDGSDLSGEASGAGVLV